MPYVACSNEHILCAVCYTQIRSENGSTCPTCRQPLLPPKVSALAKRLLLQYKICCKNVGSGCQWTGSISDEEQHNEQQVRFFLPPPSFPMYSHSSKRSAPTARLL
jgi:hypothetical protein